MDDSFYRLVLESLDSGNDEQIKEIFRSAQRIVTARGLTLAPSGLDLGSMPSPFAPVTSLSVVTPGTRVRISSKVTPKYLVGKEGVVAPGKSKTSYRRSSATWLVRVPVILDSPAGRFQGTAANPVYVPVSVLEAI